VSSISRSLWGAKTRSVIARPSPRLLATRHDLHPAGRSLDRVPLPAPLGSPASGRHATRPHSRALTHTPRPGALWFERCSFGLRYGSRAAPARLRRRWQPARPAGTAAAGPDNQLATPVFAERTSLPSSWLSASSSPSSGSG
jgi:hypothetical protein